MDFEPYNRYFQTDELRAAFNQQEAVMRNCDETTLAWYAEGEDENGLYLYIHEPTKQP